MKETKIAKENIVRLEVFIFGDVRLHWKKMSLLHKQTCQRWLEFLDTYNFNELIDEFGDRLDKIQRDEFNKKIKDLKQAIKIYDEAGI